MFAEFWYRIKNSPLSLLFVVGLLLSIGLVTLYSIAQVQAQTPPNAFSKQMIFLIPATTLMIFMTLVSKGLVHKYIYLGYGFIILALLIPFFGQKVAGTYRWINLGLPFGLQPSEIAKWVIVITLARYLSDHNLQMNNFASNLVPFAIAIIPTFIVLNQPDLGTAFVMMTPVIPMLFWVGARPYHLFLIVAPLFSILAASNELTFTIWAAILAVVIYMEKPQLWHGIGIYFGNIFLGLIFPLITLTNTTTPR